MFIDKARFPSADPDGLVNPSKTTLPQQKHQLIPSASGESCATPFKHMFQTLGWLEEITKPSHQQSQKKIKPPIHENKTKSRSLLRLLEWVRMGKMRKVRGPDIRERSSSSPVFPMHTP